MITVVAKHDRVSVVVERHAVRVVYIRLPHPRRALHSVGVETGVPRIVSEELQASGYGRLQTKVFLLRHALECWRDFEFRQGRSDSSGCSDVVV